MTSYIQANKNESLGLKSFSVWGISKNLITHYLVKHPNF